MMLASHGGVCAVVNSSCCTYIDETGQINVDLGIIKKQLGILREIQKDDTSLGFEEIWNKLTFEVAKPQMIKTITCIDHRDSCDDCSNLFDNLML